MIIGITGGTGCGKTTALQAIRELGGTVIDCDALYHELLRTDRAMLQAIGDRFPGTVTEGVLNRKALAPIVFSDPQALLDLNSITHSAVRSAVRIRLQPTPALAAIDAIELFDGGLAEDCDLTVAVTAPLESRLRRLTARDNISLEQARLRIDAQKPEAYFREKCDYILENNGTQGEFHEKCLAFFRKLTII